MAKRNETTSIVEQYRNALVLRGRTLDDCIVLAFAFDAETAVTSFHYALMSAGLKYELFDKAGRLATIIVVRGTDFDPIVEMAKEYGGQKQCHIFGKKKTSATEITINGCQSNTMSLQI